MKLYNIERSFCIYFFCLEEHSGDSCKSLYSLVACFGWGQFYIVCIVFLSLGCLSRLLQLCLGPDFSITNKIWENSGGCLQPVALVNKLRVELLGDLRIMMVGANGQLDRIENNLKRASIV